MAAAQLVRVAFAPVVGQRNAHVLARLADGRVDEGLRSAQSVGVLTGGDHGQSADELLADLEPRRGGPHRVLVATTGFWNTLHPGISRTPDFTAARSLGKSTTRYWRGTRASSTTSTDHS